MYSIIGADGNQYGPVEIQILVQWAREGRVVSDTTVMDHSTGRRFLACDLPELAALFSPANAAQGYSPGVGQAPPTQAPGYPGQPQYTAPPGNYPVAPGRPPYPPQPYPAYGMKVGPDGRPLKNRLAAGLLGILLGSFGAHRFYLGYTGVGIAMLLLTVLTCGYGSCITSVWGIIEGVLCLTGSMSDSEGRPLAD